MIHSVFNKSLVPGALSLLPASKTDSLLIMHPNIDTPMLCFSWNVTQEVMKYLFVLAVCATTYRDPDLLSILCLPALGTVSHVILKRVNERCFLCLCQ